MLSKCRKSWGLCAATATSHISLMTQSHKHALNSQSPEVLTRHQVARYFCLVWRSQCTCGVCFPKLLHAYLYLHTFLDYRGLHLDSWATIFVHIFDFPLEGIGEKRGKNSFPVHLMTWSWLHSEQKKQDFSCFLVKLLTKMILKECEEVCSGFFHTSSPGFFRFMNFLEPEKNMEISVHGT